jgi:molybdenum cofactor cytidylyltransferase
MTLSLAQALRVDSSTCVAFVGAGGKTTAMFQLARQLTPPVIVTATSHLGMWQLRLADRHVISEAASPIEEIEHGLSGVILVTGEPEGDRTKPINSERLHWLHQFCNHHSIPLLIEADGSRQKPLKSWSEHEPPIPSIAEQIVHVVGLSGLGKPLTEQYVHRPELFSKLTGLEMGARITADTLLRLLTHEEGGLKNTPQGVKRVLLLNQADTSELQSMARGMVPSLLPFYPSVLIASINEQKIHAVHEPIAGIILAAGASLRFGEAKQLLDWHGEPFVRAIARTSLEAGLSPVMVITGANAERVDYAVRDLDVKIIHNSDWETGQASSIKTGALALQNVAAGGAIFLLADQPQITTSVLRALVEKHAEGLFSVVAPMVMDQRANPVLFDRLTFNDLMSIEGDVGGRAIFHKHRVEYMPWHDDRLLLDVDTPDMYQRLITDDTL